MIPRLPLLCIYDGCVFEMTDTRWPISVPMSLRSAFAHASCHNFLSWSMQVSLWR